MFPGGDTTLVVEARRPPVPVTPAERNSAITRIRDMVAQRGVDARLDWSRIPDAPPAIDGLFLAEGGDVWVRVSTPWTWSTYRSAACGKRIRTAPGGSPPGGAWHACAASRFGVDTAPFQRYRDQSCFLHAAPASEA